MADTTIYRTGIAKVGWHYYWAIVQVGPFGDGTGGTLATDGFAATKSAAEAQLYTALRNLNADGHVRVLGPRTAWAAWACDTWHPHCHRSTDAEALHNGRLYSWHCGQRGEGEWIVYRIVKTTAKRIFVRRADATGPHGQISLNKRTLARNGSVYSHAHRRWFYTGETVPKPTSTRPAAKRVPAKLAAACTLLGLPECGFTTAALERAFRSAAKRTHPDHGGSDAAFRAVLAAKRQLIGFAIKR